MLRQRAKSALLAGLVAAGLVGGSCGGGDEPPATPPSYPDAASLIPTAPAPQPTPTPTPGSSPSGAPPTPTPAGQEALLAALDRAEAQARQQMRSPTPQARTVDKDW